MALVAATPIGPLLEPRIHVPAAAMVTGLAAAFVLAELTALHIEFRRETYSFHLSGVPLVIGVIFAPTPALLTARLAGALLVIGLQRPQPLKAAYNVTAYALEVGLVCALAHVALPDLAVLDLSSGARLYAVVAVADVVLSLLVLRVIGWHQGPLTRIDALGVLLPATALGLASTVVALTAVQLASTGALGWVLIALSAPALVAVHHAYVLLQRRHQSLALVHDFVAESKSTGSVEDLATRLMDRLLRLLRASWIELVRVEDGAPRGPILRVNEDGTSATLPNRDSAAVQWLLARSIAEDEAILVPRRPRDAALRRWLVATGTRDAMVVPLIDNGTTLGVLTIGDRLGESATFTSHDLALAQTLAAHTAVAVRNATLMHQLRYEANHDALTGLANRAMVDDFLEAMAARLAGTPQGRAGVILLDLDGFKDVNDALGHHAGDRLLVIVGERLEALAPAKSIVARLGGDEFAILLPDVQESAEAHTLAENAAQALRTPVRLDEVVVSAAASIGVAVSQPGGVDCADLLRQADLAMYAAKEAPHPVVAYSPELDQGHADRLSLIGDLQQAMASGGLSVVYQPKVALGASTAIGVEALVRWNHPDRGFVPPDVFVPLAESTGLIGDLTRYVLLTALTQVKAWRDQGLDVSVAVNLSARNLSDAALPTMVCQALKAMGLPPSALLLEITESCVMDTHASVMPVLEAIVAQGVRLSLDDFGTGYSSLSYLQKLPVQEVKIDRSFVQAMSAPAGSQPGPDRARLLVRAIVDLAAGMGLSVVAEGVEDLPALRELTRMGCHEAQGYYLCRPGPPEKIAAYLREHAKRIPTQTLVRVV